MPSRFTSGDSRFGGTSNSPCSASQHGQHARHRSNPFAQQASSHHISPIENFVAHALRASTRVAACRPRSIERRHERDAVLAHVKALAVRFAVDADLRAVRHHGSFVDDRVADHAALADAHARQHDGAIDRRVVVHAHAREQQRVRHARAGNDAAARHHRVDGATAAIGIVEHELRGRQLFLVRPDRPLFVVDVQLGRDAHELHGSLRNTHRRCRRRASSSAPCVRTSSNG